MRGSRVIVSFRHASMSLNLIRNWIHTTSSIHTSFHTTCIPRTRAFERSYLWQNRFRRMDRDRERQLIKQRQNENTQRAQKSDSRQRLRGHPKDEEGVRISKTLSWLLRHGAKQEGLAMRADGYVRVNDLVRSHFTSIDIDEL